MPGQLGPASEGGGQGLYGIYTTDATSALIANEASFLAKRGGKAAAPCNASAHAAPAAAANCTRTRVDGLPGTGRALSRALRKLVLGARMARTAAAGPCMLGGLESKPVYACQGLVTIMHSMKVAQHEGRGACDRQAGVCMRRFEGPACDVDINECVRGTANCAANSTCTNSNGSFSCACWEGFAGTMPILRLLK